MAGRTRKAQNATEKRMSLAEKMQRFERRKREAGVDWGKVDGIRLITAIHTMLAADVAVMIAPTAGGRGVMIKVYEDGEAQSEYIMNADDVNDHLDTLIDAFQSSSEDVRQLFPVPGVGVSGD